MARYRKKPIEIEAFRWNGSDEIPAWAASRSTIGLLGGTTRVLNVKTAEGVTTARAGDWIIRGVEGEVYPCKASVFDKTYEPVTEEVA